MLIGNYSPSIKAMGNADSKDVNAGGAEVTRMTSKDSQFISSFEGEEAEYHEDGEEKKDLENMITPRTRTRKPKGNKTKLNHINNEDHTSIVSSQVTDDQVHVNLAMADLMAYLQVVANNSNHLPLTRRDDPEIDGMVSTLTSEEYARKSAAFIPADVRLIGGSFTRYGRVWDLPTSEEYNACDGAHEPGRSYGGACVNSMLKVLYDDANNIANLAEAEAASDALFDDDTEDDDDSSYLGKSFKSCVSMEYATPTNNTISWADLLRKMKVEVKDIEYAQVPKITTTRKMDLNKPFSLAPENFDPTVGKKRSLLIGCNYTNIHGAELKASHDDIKSMKDYIVNVHGFQEGKGMMTVLLDGDGYKHPTFHNITEAFNLSQRKVNPETPYL